MALDRSARNRWTAKLEKQNALVVKGIEDLLVLIAEASEAGVSNADIAYNLTDLSSHANIARGVSNGTSATGIMAKVKHGQTLRARREASDE
jgi:hypothetical protein